MITEKRQICVTCRECKHDNLYESWNQPSGALTMVPLIYPTKAKMNEWFRCNVCFGHRVRSNSADGSLCGECKLYTFTVEESK